MVMNRMSGVFEEPEEHARAPDYWEVRGRCGVSMVSAETAQKIIADLSRIWPPRWIRFRDLSGSEVMLPTRSIDWVWESKGAQRAFDRRMRRLLEAENDEEARPGSERGRVARVRTTALRPILESASVSRGEEAGVRDSGADPVLTARTSNDGGKRSDSAHRGSYARAGTA
jgi:hypothetical protein